jgi:hypothetical protein
MIRKAPVFVLAPAMALAHENLAVIHPFPSLSAGRATSLVRGNDAWALP